MKTLLIWIFWISLAISFLLNAAQKVERGDSLPEIHWTVNDFDGYDED